ncbi:MAG: hypothetical protein H6733_07070 [Alphaproteobacteria bacterium]|nr:hypothetical protein [Alphaproteobacteria bacterium]
MSRRLFATVLTALAVTACNGTDDKDTDTDTDTTADTDTDTTIDTDTTVDTDTCAGVVDDCGVCDGDNADKDCAGVCFGSAVEDACGTCDDDATNDCVASFSTSGAWSCSGSQSCQDVFPLTLTEGTVLDLAATNITGSSVVRLALFAPGDGLDGTNLLTNRTNDYRCGNQNAATVIEGFVVPEDGDYLVAIGRDWGSSAGSTGSYDFTIDASPGLVAGDQTVEDGVSEATGSRCGFVDGIDAGWECAVSTSCQDVYDVDLVAGTTVDLTVYAVSGSSVVRLAMFPPGTALDGTNALLGGTYDQMCWTQNTSAQRSSFHIDTTGTWRVAVGRDWGASSGTGGTYTFELNQHGSWATFTPTVDDEASQATGGQCPI